MRGILQILLSGFCLIALIGPIFASGYEFPVYTRVKTLPDKLKMLYEQFITLKTYDEQKLSASYLFSAKEKEKYDIMMDIALIDLKGGEQYGNTYQVYSLVRIEAVSNAALTGDPKYESGYWTILRFDKTLDTRLMAIEGLKKIGTKSSVRILSEFLKQQYNYEPFDVENSKMEREDRVAEAMVTALGSIGQPKGIPVLLQIVNMQNHRHQTLEAAWTALEKMKVDNRAYKYFIISLRDTMREKTDQVPSAYKEQVMKTVITLEKFIRGNFMPPMAFTEEDVDTVKRIPKEFSEQSSSSKAP